jgi:hypothetical protein
MVVKWLDSNPEKCDICAGTLYHKLSGKTAFIDGRTKYGQWANMCVSCYLRIGVGLGVGRGQLYEKQDNGNWIKTRG